MIHQYHHLNNIKLPCGESPCRAPYNTRILFLFSMIAATILIPIGPADAQALRWDGTPPFCNGSCGPNETELTRLSAIPDFWTPPAVIQTVPFGGNCLTGTKALCQTTAGPTCRWDGTAPFCAGKCKANERQGNPPPGSSSGHACWSGSKVYCCKNVASTSQPLQARIGAIRSGAGKCVDVHAPDQHKNGAKVQVWNCNKTIQQLWIFENGAIKSGAGKCLDVHAPDQNKNGGRVQVWACNNSPQQTWVLEGARIRSSAGKCLDVHAPDQFKNGGRLQIWDCNNTLQQTWLTP